MKRFLFFIFYFLFFIFLVVAKPIVAQSPTPDPNFGKCCSNQQPKTCTACLPLFNKPLECNNATYSTKESCDPDEIKSLTKSSTYIKCCIGGVPCTNYCLTVSECRARGGLLLSADIYCTADELKNIQLTPMPTIVQPQSVNIVDYFNPMRYLPGFGCGVPEASGSASMCCPGIGSANIECNFGFIDALKGLPVVKDWISGITSKCNDAKKGLEDLKAKSGQTECLEGLPDTSSGKCVCKYTGNLKTNPTIEQMCKKYINSSGSFFGSDKQKSTSMKSCMVCSVNGFWTAIGCIPLTTEGFVNYLFSFGIGLAGIVALLCIFYSVIILQTSRGNPERIKKAQENLTSCIMGLMLIIFSVFLLKLIGVDILKIPFISKS